MNGHNDEIAQSLIGLLHYSLLGNGDIVAAGVLHHIHHLVGLTDDLMGALGIFGIAGYTHAGADIQRDIFDIECSAPHDVAQTSGHDHGGIFVGLGKQNDKFIAAITKGVINQTKVRFDLEANFSEQLAPNQVSIGIVDLLKVI